MPKETSTSTSASIPSEEAMLLFEAGYLYAEMRRFEEAQALFEGMAVLFPESELPYLGLGSVWLCQGEPRKALSEHRLAQRKAPKSGVPHVHAAEALLLLGKSKEAAQECQKALRLEPVGPVADFVKNLVSTKELELKEPQTSRSGK